MQRMQTMAFSLLIVRVHLITGVHLIVGVHLTPTNLVGKELMLMTLLKIIDNISALSLSFSLCPPSLSGHLDTYIIYDI